MPGGDLLHGRQVGGRHHGRLVNDEQVTGPDRQVPAGGVAVFDLAQEVSDVMALSQSLAGEHMGRAGGGSQPDHQAGSGVNARCPL